MFSQVLDWIGFGPNYFENFISKFFLLFDDIFSFQKSGIDKIIPNMIIDDFLFEPYGYSMNGVTKNVSTYIVIYY